MKRYSIKNQIMIIFIGLMATTLIISWFVNNMLLVKSYTSKKQTAMNQIYELLDNAVSSKMVNTSHLEIELKRISDKENISGVGIGTDLTPFIIWRSQEKKNDNLANRLVQYIFEQDDDKGQEILEENNNYIIQKAVNNQVDAEYLELWGQFSDGSWIIMQTSVDGIKENVKVANKLLAYIGLLTLVLSGTALGFLSKKITDPVMELVSISEKMTELDFEAKYTSGGKNELGILGKNFNMMAETLEYTISELKTANNELQSDIEQKEKTDEMRKEFLANVSHELKTPISLIQGYAEGLKEGIADDKESRDFYCEVIMDEAAKMNKMVKNLLSLNQLESESAVTMERFDIVALMKGVLQSTEIMIQQKEAKVVFEEEEAIYVWADEFKVEEVLTNYLSNALHHLKGERIIEIRICRNQDTVRILVFNTGDPIPEEDLDKIWGKFYKVDKARTREYGGNGIGLSIVKAIMDSFHKECGVTNYANGVEFWFELDCKL